MGHLDLGKGCDAVLLIFILLQLGWLLEDQGQGIGCQQHGCEAEDAPILGVIGVEHFQRLSQIIEGRDVRRRAKPLKRASWA